MSLSAALLSPVIYPYAKLGHAESRRTDYLARPTEPSEAGPSRFPGSYEMGHDSLGVTVSHAVSTFSLFSTPELHFLQLTERKRKG